MRYLNTVTKATFDTDFKVSGGDWVLDDELKEEVEETDHDDADKKTVEPVGDETTGDENYDAVTKAQITQELDAFGVEYDKKATKRVLYDLMLAQEE